MEISSKGRSFEATRYPLTFDTIVAIVEDRSPSKNRIRRSRRLDDAVF